MDFELDRNNIPASIAIIMDGNGRWAQTKGMPRTAGHAEGVERVKDITAEAARLGCKFLTLYAFSTENWNRPAPEIEALMTLLIDHLEEETFMKNNVRLLTIGEFTKLPPKVQERVQACIDHTANNTRMTMVVALSYSSRWELTETMRHMAQEVKEGRLQPEDITEESISEHLQTSFMPDPDLLIRTGGELRISNYLLWQIAYSELYFTSKYWPDFTKEDFVEAIADFQGRERRYGKTSEQVNNEHEA